jgi:hypothetical protein
LELARNKNLLAYTYGSKKGGSSPLGAAATHPASDIRIKLLATSTTPSTALK